MNNIEDQNDEDDDNGEYNNNNNNKIKNIYNKMKCFVLNEFGKESE